MRLCFCLKSLFLFPPCCPSLQVRGIILDPSCSGSGTVYTRMDHLLPSYKQPAARAGVAGADGKGRKQHQGSGREAEEVEEEEMEEVVEVVEEEGRQGEFEVVEEVDEGQGEEQEDFEGEQPDEEEEEDQEAMAVHGAEGGEDEAGMRRVEQLARFQVRHLGGRGRCRGAGSTHCTRSCLPASSCCQESALLRLPKSS